MSHTSGQFSAAPETSTQLVEGSIAIDSQSKTGLLVQGSRVGNGVGGGNNASVGFGVGFGVGRGVGLGVG